MDDSTPGTTRPSGGTHVTGRRTRLRPGLEARYETVHARIPEPVFEALRACGVVSWRIWRDGRSLFHCIETERGYDAMVERIVALGPIDPEWDATIAALLEQDEEADALLPAVWTMDRTRQYAGAAGTGPAAPA
ncbi:L-rhamnose mutarotase [Kitasatospora sp. NA04385]|uniref:L-rhamnose mutarotase n=1 Tax=Kitasatospora sp. NA04385 TaxID=2742135 RepID=UPI0015920113|nr:L-rhamnose mutarotase [Kitasatospora sp. NA04385]QKW17739.1 L-rhamnose mutarotase [Kitasatospora sp. NA04385]